MPDKTSYKVGETIYDIPDDKKDGFLSKYKDAVEVKSFVSGKDTFDIPIGKADAFLQKYPEAKLMTSDQPGNEPEKPVDDSADNGLPKSDAKAIGYSPETDRKEALDKFGLSESTSVAKNIRNMEQLGLPVEEHKKNLQEHINDIAISPVKNAYEGWMAGAKEIHDAQVTASPGDRLGDYVRRDLQYLEGGAKMLFGALHVVPATAIPIALWDMSTEAAGKIIPEKAIGYMMSPVSNAINDLGITNPSIKALGGLTDIGWQMFAIHSLKEAGKGKTTEWTSPEALAEKIKNKEPMSKKEVEDAAKHIGNLTPEQLQHAAKETVVNSVHEDLRHSLNHKISLETDQHTIANTVGNDVAETLTPDVKKAQEDFQKQTELITQREKINAALAVATNDGAKKVLGAQLKSIQQEIDKGNPKAESKKEFSPSSDQPAVQKELDTLAPSDTNSPEVAARVEIERKKLLENPVKYADDKIAELERRKGLAANAPPSAESVAQIKNLEGQIAHYEKLKKESAYAIQKPGTEGVDVRQSSGDGATVGKGNAKEKKTSEARKEEIVPATTELKDGAYTDDMSDVELKALRQEMDNNGWKNVAPVIVEEGTNKILDGNKRNLVSDAAGLEEKKVQYVPQGTTVEEAQAINKTNEEKLKSDKLPAEQVEEPVKTKSDGQEEKGNEAKKEEDVLKSSGESKPVIEEKPTTEAGTKATSYTEEQTKSYNQADANAKTAGFRGIDHAVAAMKKYLGEDISKEDFAKLSKKEIADKKVEIDKAKEESIPPQSEEEITKAYAERAKELEKLKGTPEYKNQIIHDNFVGVPEKSWNEFGDRNWNDKNFKRKFFNKSALDLDQQAQEMSEAAGVEITPQDIVNYIMDRESNKGKYRVGGKSVSTLNKAAKIKPADAEELIRIFDEQGIDVSTPEAIEKVRGFPISNEDADLLIEYLQSDEAKKSKPGASKSVPSDTKPVGEGEKVEEKTTTASGTKQSVKTKSDITRERLDAAKTALSNKLRTQMQSAGLGALPEFKEYVKAFVSHYGNKIEDFIKKFREDFPESKHSDDDLKAAFEESNKESPKVIGTKNAITEALKEQFGLPKVEIPKDRSDAESILKAKEDIDSGTIDPVSIVNELLSDTDIYDKKISANDEPRMNYYILQLYERGTELNKQNAILDERIEAGDKEAVAEKATLTQTLLNHYDELGRALDASEVGGNIWGKIGRERQIAVNEQGQIINSINRIKAIYGKDIPDLVSKKLTELQMKYDELIAKNAEIEKRLKEAEEKKSATQTRRAKRTGADFVKERQDIISDMKEALKKASAKTYTTIPLAPQLTAIAPHVLRLMRSYAAEGAVKASDMVDKLHEDVKSFLDGITKDDIKDIVSGKYNEKKPLSELNKRLADLRSQIKKQQIIEDLEKGVVAETKKRGEGSPEVQVLNKRLADLKKKIPNEFSDVSAKQLKNESESIQRKIIKGDYFKQPTIKRQWENHPQWIKNNREKADLLFTLRNLERAAMDSKKSQYMRALDWTNRWGRRVIFFGANAVYTKLSSAAVLGTFVHRIPEQLLGQLNAKAFPHIAGNAPIEGAMNAHAEGKFYKEFTNPVKALKSWWSIAKTGETELSKELSTFKHDRHIPIVDLFAADPHIMIKDPVKRAIFEASLINHLKFYENNGIDPTHPLMLESARQAAYKRAEYEIFQNNEKNGSAVKSFFNQLEKSGIVNNAMPDGWSKVKGNAQYTAASLYHFFVPINTIAVNIMKRVGLGLKTPITMAEAMSKNKAIRDGILNLTQEESDIIMRQLKKGQIGTAYWTLGFILGAPALGGLWNRYYSDNDRDGDVPAANTMTLKGVDVSKNVQHMDKLEAMQMGATWNITYNHFIDDDGDSQMQAILKATAATGGVAAEQLPTLEFGGRAYEALTSPYGGDKFMNDLKRRVGIGKAASLLQLMGYESMDEDSGDSLPEPEMGSGNNKNEQDKKKPITTRAKQRSKKE